MAGGNRLASRIAAAVAIALVAAPAGAHAQGVSQVAVSFAVVNSNASRAPCQTDGRQYTVHGRLVSPSPATGARGVTVLLHGVDAVGYMHLAAYPQLDLASRLAQRGHVVLALDRLGYGASGRPPGSGSCLGGHADVARQVAQQLRAGSYTVEGGTATSFHRVALAGHSGGAIVTQVAAYSFPVFDAIVVMGFADQGYRPAFPLGVAAGELPQCGMEPDVYRYFFTDEDFDRYALTGVAAPVRAAVERARNPCGDPGSFQTVLAADALYLREIDAPALLLYGARDELIDPAGAALQEDRYSGNGDVTTIVYEDGGHTFFLQDGIAAHVHADMSAWLAARGL